MRTLLIAAAGAALLTACGPKTETAAKDAAPLDAAPADNAQAAADGPGGAFQPQTLDEMMKRAMARFDAADTDGDGKLTQAEIEAARPARPPGGADGPDAAGGPGGGRRGGFARADANGDGVVTREEVQQQTRERFARLDADGVVTREEMRASFAGRRGGAGPTGDGGPPE